MKEGVAFKMIVREADLRSKYRIYAEVSVNFQRGAGDEKFPCKHASMKASLGRNQT